jgi:hypothetical protein
VACKSRWRRDNLVFSRSVLTSLVKTLVYTTEKLWKNVSPRTHFFPMNAPFFANRFSGGIFFRSPSRARKEAEDGINIPRPLP